MGAGVGVGVGDGVGVGAGGAVGLDEQATATDSSRPDSTARESILQLIEGA